MKVSVCIPTYKQVDFLRCTLSSVASQDFKNYELIITDDSPDDSIVDLLKEFSFGDKLRYCKNTPSKGSPENWNVALRMARGEYVKILHHDDMFTRPDSLRQFVKMLDENEDADFAFSATLLKYVDTGISRIHRPTSKQLSDLKKDPASLFVGNWIGAPSVTICRRLINLEYDARMKWLVDIDFYYQVLMQNRRFIYTAETLVQTPTNASHQVTEICRNNVGIELGEAMLMFKKFSMNQRKNPLVKQGWSQLFRRFKIRKIEDLYKFGLKISSTEKETEKYFITLILQSYSIVHLLRDPSMVARKITFRLYILVHRFF